MADSTMLVNTRGQPLIQKNDAAFHVASQPFMPQSIGVGRRVDLQGATPNPRRHDYKLYLDMYNRHWLIKTAIDKKAMVATNTGWEFVPRRRNVKEVPEDQGERAASFFDDQDDFLDQLRMIYIDLDIFGDGFFYVVPDRRRRPKRLKHLAPWTIHIKAKKNGTIEKYVQVVGDEVRTFKPHEIIHFRHANPDDALYGMSRLEAIKATVTSDLYAEYYNLNFFKNGAATGVMFVVNDADQATLEMNKKWIREEYVGTENAHKPIILAGDVKVERSVASHQDMGYLEGRDANKKAILAALDVPPAKIGDMETANRSNSKEQDKSFRTETIMPLQYIIEQGLSNFLRDVLDCPDVQFKHSEGDIRDAQDQMALWEKASKNGYMSINEIRARMGLPNIEGGDITTMMTPVGAVPIVDLELYFSLSKPNTDKIPRSAHNHKGDVDDAHNVDGPAPNSKETDNGVVTGARPTSKSATSKVPVSLASVATFIDGAADDEDIFRHCFTYLIDAAEDAPHPMLDDAVKAYQKARKYRDDVELKKAYLERVSVLVKNYEGVLNEQ